MSRGGSDVDFMVGDLLPPRPRVAKARFVTWTMKLSILFRLIFIVYARAATTSWWHRVASHVVEVVPEAVFEMWGFQIEMMVTSLVFLNFARWEDQEHWLTTWQTLYVLEVLSVREVLYNDVALISVAFVGLYLTYFVGVYTEFTKREKPRLPPFPYKKNDTDRPRHGWLGRSISQRISWKIPRMIFTALLYIVGLTVGLFMLYAMLVSEVDNLRHLPLYKNNENDVTILIPLLIVAVVASTMAVIPSLLVEYGAIPGLVKDLINFKRSSRSYRTGVWDVCELDEDKDGPGPELRKQMSETKLLDTTIVLPCYLPNEEPILPFVWEHYLKEFEKLDKFEAEVCPKGEIERCQKRILLVWNSPQQHPDFAATVKEWQQKFEAKGFHLDEREHKQSTSKCDNLNLACELIKTETCCLNDADTMLDWSCMARGSLHISNGYDIAQAMNSHCKWDCRGTPGDEEERQCHPYGILITIGDSTKPQNMSTQTPFKHAPFNGRGGFWRTEALKKVGFDHRTVGEDHDAGYRGCAYFGMKGILDMNMLCQEQEPPDCKALTSQRIRWETAALEMRRTYSWIIRSKNYTNFEIFVLLWGQLQQNCNLPLQSLPFQIATALPFVIIKGWLSIYAFGPTSDASFCAERNCVWSFPITNPVNGTHWIVALPLPLVIFVGVMIIFLVVNAFDFCIRVLSTRYNPRCMFFVYYGLLKSMFVVPYFVYVQYWALYDYCWGGAKFIATARSPLSPKKEAEGGLEKPLLQK